MFRRSVRPNWFESAPPTGSWRSVFKYGNPYEFKHPSARWVEMIKKEFGMTNGDFSTRRDEGLSGVTLDRPPMLDPLHKERIEAIVGKPNVADDDYSRVKYSSGKTTEELLELRKGIVPSPCDLVVHPRNKHDVQEIVSYCHERGIHIHTYGAGSSVTFGVRPEPGGVTLVLSTHMNRVVSISELNQTARVQPGILGPAFEEALRRAPELYHTKHRYTCGHFPQSFEHSSVGGWIVTLGSGQASSYYGDAYDLVVSQEYVTPAGTLVTREFPAEATGPKLNDIMKGSEGAFGVLVEATVRIFRHMPANTRYFSFMFPSWGAAVDACREISQGEFGMPAVFRISDPEETHRGLKLYGMPAWVDAILRRRGLKPMERCLFIGTAEGQRDFSANVERQVTRICRSFGAVGLTGYPARKWEQTRFKEPYMREDLMDFGVVIDTLETSVTWENLHRVYTGVRSYMTSRPHTMCMTHASHFYAQGTNLYFIFLTRVDDLEEYRSFHRGIVESIVSSGGSLSHHHGVGRLFAGWMETYLGAPQVDVLRTLKRHFDPRGIMNPGVLVGL